mmetsp:Transcript_5476/g.13995  ORF Transcript_5476/g.13995 Transcript_5476/m.13995 type:complete len:359 (-) Transcript_5476:458-1534(-)
MVRNRVNQRLAQLGVCHATRHVLGRSGAPAWRCAEGAGQESALEVHHWLLDQQKRAQRDHEGAHEDEDVADGNVDAREGRILDRGVRLPHDEHKVPQIGAVGQLREWLPRLRGEQLTHDPAAAREEAVRDAAQRGCKQRPLEGVVQVLLPLAPHACGVVEEAALVQVAPRQHDPARQRRKACGPQHHAPRMLVRVRVRADRPHGGCFARRRACASAMLGAACKAERGRRTSCPARLVQIDPIQRANGVCAGSAVRHAVDVLRVRAIERGDLELVYSRQHAARDDRRSDRDGKDADHLTRQAWVQRQHEGGDGKELHVICQVPRPAHAARSARTPVFARDVVHVQQVGPPVLPAVRGVS